MQYYQIKIEVNENKKPSLFIGSALRGAFGHALKERSCINPTFSRDEAPASSCILE